MKYSIYLSNFLLYHSTLKVHPSCPKCQDYNFLWLSNIPCVCVCVCVCACACVYIYIWSEVAQSCPTLCDPMDCSLPGFSVNGIFQARVLELVAIHVYVYIYKYACMRAQSLSRDWLLWLQELWSTRLLCPQNFPGKNTGWVAISYSRLSSWPRDQTPITYTGRWIL